MALPISPRRRRTSLIPIAPRTSRSWLCQPATRLRMRAAPHSVSTRVELDRAGYALRAPLAHAALHGDQQRDVDADGICAADDELRHVLRHRHAPGADDGHEVPDAFIDEMQMDLPHPVLDEHGLFCRVEAVEVGDEMDHFGPGRP